MLVSAFYSSSVVRQDSPKGAGGEGGMLKFPQIAQISAEGGIGAKA